MPDDTQVQAHLTPMTFPEDYVPGKYAPWYCSDEDVFGPDELGEYANHIEDMIQAVNKSDVAARYWEVLQAWEARLFRRGYHFLNAGQKGWGLFGGSVTGPTTGAGIMQTGNAMKLFACNVYGQRHKKIVALLSREVPGVQIVPKRDDDSIDQAAAEEAEKYLKVFMNDANLKTVVTQAAGYFYTDDRVGFLTYTVADQSRWGTESPQKPDVAYGIPESEGVTPETELQQENDSDQPARREATRVFGKLECRVPLMANEEHEMGWQRYQWEESSNTMKAQYPWIADSIATQGNASAADQIDRLARINVRLAVQASSSSGEGYKNDATHTVTFFRPSEYRTVKDKNVQDIFFQTFPDGMEVWHAGGTLAMVRNCRITDHCKIAHPTPGDGQNREAIGTNYLPLQKVLNANISLLDRYFRSAVPRRFALEPYIDTQVLNSQSNDPAKVTPVTGLENKNLTIDQITGLEKTPQPNDAIFNFVEWLINGGPEAMDGGSATVWGEGETSNEDRGFVGTAKLRKEAALQVFSMPWAALCDAVCAISLQAIESAAKNRVANINASLPGQQRIQVEIERLRGSVLCHPESLEIPRTLAEQEQQMAELLAESANVALYQQIMMDPRNLAVFSKFPSLIDLSIPGADAVEQQQGEFEILMSSGPIPNPQLQPITEQLMQAQNDPEAQTPEGQQALQQLQQAAQSMPPLVSTVPVAQDTSENHMVHAAITLGMLTSATGRKLKNGDDEQKQIYQNLKLHWQEHMTVLKALQPPKEMEFKGNVTIDPSKFPPQAQAEMFEAMGLQVPPFALNPQDDVHEVTREQEGVDAQGVPTKTKVSFSGKPLN